MFEAQLAMLFAVGFIVVGVVGLARGSDGAPALLLGVIVLAAGVAGMSG